MPLPGFLGTLAGTVLNSIIGGVGSRIQGSIAGKYAGMNPGMAGLTVNNQMQSAYQAAEHTSQGNSQGQSMAFQAAERAKDRAHEANMQSQYLRAMQTNTLLPWILSRDGQPDAGQVPPFRDAAGNTFYEALRNPPSQHTDPQLTPNYLPGDDPAFPNLPGTL